MSFTTLSVATHAHAELVDITSQVREAVAASGVATGLLVLFTPHTTAGITINENADPDVAADMLGALDRMVPWRHASYRHGEGNSAAHVKASLMGAGQTLLIEEGRPALGAWQGIYLCEFDGPRTRKVYIKITA